MTREYRPAGEALAAVLAGRVDALEEQVRQHSGDVAALGRGVATLTAEIRRGVAAASDQREQTPPAADQEETAGAEAEAEEDGQPDWIAVTDVEQAQALLTAMHDWSAHALAPHGLTFTASVPCWPLHPDVVIELLALAAERETAYAGPAPTPVSEWLSRWLPAARTRINDSLADCLAERGHHANGHVYDARALDLDSVAAWWVTDRHTPAHDVFALPRY